MDLMVTISFSQLTALAYGFDESAVTLIANYLLNRYQRVKIGSKFRSYLEILRGVPQSSNLSPILFNLFINDLIFFIPVTEVCNFTCYYLLLLLLLLLFPVN